MVEQIIPATMKLPESLWKKIRTKAIWEGVTVSKLVQKALEDSLAADAGNGRKRKSNGNGDSQ